MITAIAFIVAIGLLVAFHELGHYWMARRFGVKVLRFSIGFGSVIYRKRFAGSDTEWVVSAVPLGGYVKMVDEREEKVAAEDLPYAFNRKPAWQRMAIVLAGPLANFLLAIILYWGLFLHGVPGIRPILGDVPAGTPAAIAQLHAGETIVSVDGEPVPSWQDLHWELLQLALKKHDVKIEGRESGGATLLHTLDISSLEVRDLEGDFFEKLGLQLYQPVVPPVIGSVIEGGVAEQAGLKEGDRILSANGKGIERWMQFVDIIRANPGTTVHLRIQRQDSALDVSVVPQSAIESGKAVGRIGAGAKMDEADRNAMLTEVRYGPVVAMVHSFGKTWQTSSLSLRMIGKMVTGEVSFKSLSGPITIADYAGQSAKIGILAYLSFLALISISLGVLNLLPIPLLDGGHLLYYGVELLKGSPVSEIWWEIGQKIGIAIIGTLMVFAIYNDINRFVSG
jgi:regulator of sigma E protease